jgi:PPOX class probable F420-dependent enzyme
MTTIPESHRDLLEAQFATLATVGPDGRPQLTEVWFLETGGEIALSLNMARQKTKNLSADAHCSLFILDIANPYRYLELRGDAVISPDDGYLFADAVGSKYSSDLRVHDQPGDKRVKVVILPTHVNAVNMGG